MSTGFKPMKESGTITEPSYTHNYSTNTGISLGFWEVFITKHGGRKTFEGLTGYDVKERFVKPDTSESKLSLCHHLLLEKKLNGALCAYVGKPAWFVSHAYSYMFLDVYDALLSFFKNDKSTFVYYDIFSLDQHREGTIPYRAGSIS